MSALASSVTVLEAGSSKLSKAGWLDCAVDLSALAALRARQEYELWCVALDIGHDLVVRDRFEAKRRRYWMSIRHWLAGFEPDGVLDVVERSEADTWNAYRRALAGYLSPPVRAAVAQQFLAISCAHAMVLQLRHHARL
jgi:uncharacterized protein (TIGR02284 family)